MTDRNPLLDPDTRLVVAHRGNRVRVAENTLESLVDAVELGADALEFDVRVTRDGVPVLMHDPTVDRTTSGRGAVSDYTLAELRELDAGRSFPGAGVLRVPTLEEVLDRLRATPLVIEIKEVAAIAPAEALIRRFDLGNRVLLGSVSQYVSTRLYRSGLRTCASFADATRLIPRALIGLSAAPSRYDVLSITTRYRGVPIPVLRMARAARKAGIATQVWTVNDPAMARALWAGGVAGIVTDDPAAILRARSQ